MEDRKGHRAARHWHLAYPRLALLGVYLLASHGSFQSTSIYHLEFEPKLPLANLYAL